VHVKGYAQENNKKPVCLLGVKKNNLYIMGMHTFHPLGIEKISGILPTAPCFRIFPAGVWKYHGIIHNK